MYSSSYYGGSVVRSGTSASQAQAQAEAEAVRRRQQQYQQSVYTPPPPPPQTNVGVAPGMMKAELVVPVDAYPGKSVRIAVQGKEYMVVIPNNARPGQKIMIQVPIATPAVQAQPIEPHHHHRHHSTPPPQQDYVPFAAYAAQPPPPPQQASYSAPPVPPPQYGTPQYAAPPAAQYAAPPAAQYSGMTPPSQYSAPPSQYSAPAAQYGAASSQSYTTQNQGYSGQSYSNVPAAITTTGVTPAPRVEYGTAPAYNPAAVIPPSAPSSSGSRLANLGSSSLSESGRQAFSQAMTSQALVVITNHLISEEQRESYAEHNIISVYEGETVTLIEGDLNTGLPSPYEDYVTVKTDDGRQGKVAKVALRLK